MAVSGKGLAALGIGSVFLWSGVKGWSILGTLGDIITGKKPSQTPANVFQFQAPDESQSVGGGTAGSAGSIADIASQYKGHAYSYGGAPGQDGSKPWDCSSFVNFVVGIRMGVAIPGYGPGAYNGKVHGPPTGTWGIWSGLQHVSRSEVQRGDIVVWLNHMGIALANNEMISALNERAGTDITPIDGHGNGPILCYGRYSAAGPGPTYSGIPNTGSPPPSGASNSHHRAV